jgi:hypothetical protein
MSHLQSHSVRRRGAVTPLLAFLLTTVVGMLALSIDLGYIALVRAELQNAADAAALAGASQLLDQSLLRGGSETPATDKARNQAYTFAYGNTAAGAALAPDLNSSNTATGDIVCGYFANPGDRSEPMSLTPPTGALYNAVQVRVARDSAHASVGNDSLRLFFARALGVVQQDVHATASACVQGGVLGFQAQTPGRDFCSLLPYALKYSDWIDQVVLSNGPDGWARTLPSAMASPPNNVTAEPDGIYEVKLFPVANINTGDGGVPLYNFGQVDIGSPNNSTADVKRQFLTGVGVSDLAWYSAANGYASGFQMSPDASSPTGYSMILQGETGISAGMEADLRSIIGQPRILPLYATVSPTGTTAQFTIVKFVGVTILEVNLSGSTTAKHITIQPCFSIEPNTIAGGTSDVSQFVVRPVALVR